jgi:ABC-type lipoprotein export system ATPase subunit
MGVLDLLRPSSDPSDASVPDDVEALDPPADAPVIQLRDITKAYRNGFSKTFVLRQVDLDIEEGEFVTIMGPSGAGKSTLLHIMGLLDEPSEGEYHFLGEPAHQMREKRRTQLHRTHIGFVFQAYHLIDDLTVYENLETPLLYKGLPKNERKSKVADMLDRFGIVAKQDLFPNQLSGGQQQLVGVARALIIEPRVILADEPTGNLQSSQSEEIMQTLRRLNDEDDVTIVQVTHSERQASYGDRVVRLTDGLVKGDFPADELEVPAKPEA